MGNYLTQHTSLYLDNFLLSLKWPESELKQFKSSCRLTVSLHLVSTGSHSKFTVISILYLCHKLMKSYMKATISFNNINTLSLSPIITKRLFKMFSPHLISVKVNRNSKTTCLLKVIQTLKILDNTNKC